MRLAIFRRGGRIRRTTGASSPGVPYLDQGPLAKQINLIAPVSLTNGFYAATVALPLFRCPSDVDHLDDFTDAESYVPFQHNNYRGNAGNQLALRRPARMSLPGFLPSSRTTTASS